jgi:hypothetical protein
MMHHEGLSRRSFLRGTTGGVLGLSLARGTEARAVGADEKLREVVKGIQTRRVVQGEPYELAGKRLVFTNWYYVRPGDLDWLNDKGQSVYVKGSEGPWGAHYKGVDTPRGIRLVTQKPDRILGPIERPSRGIIQDGRLLRGRDSSAYYVQEPLVVEHSDTEIVAYYDLALRKYVLYTRYWSVGPRSERLPPDIRHCRTGVGRRAIGRSATECAPHRSWSSRERGRL